MTDLPNWPDEAITPLAVNLTGAAAATDVLTSQLAGDAQPRFVVNADGRLEWGPGNAALDTNLYRSAANSLETDDHLTVGITLTVGSTVQMTGTGGSGYLEGREQSAPPVGSADRFRLYAEDDAGGKTRLMVIFGSGAAQQIAIEP